MIQIPAAQEVKIVLQTVPAGRIPDVVDLHRAVFAPGQVACTIYACAGAGRYLASLAAFPQFQQEHILLGAWQGQDLIAYAHFRALPEAWHLNNIAVHPAWQGKGIGSQIWVRFVEAARQRGFRLLTLDVESDNLPAVRWYRQRGLEVSGAVWRYEKSINAEPHAAQDQPGIRLVGWDQAEAWQSVYGFSQFQIHCEDQIWDIGRLGERFFKVSQPLPLIVEKALYQIDPSRCLLIFSNEPLAEPGMRMLGKSLRMRGELRKTPQVS